MAVLMTPQASDTASWLYLCIFNVPLGQTRSSQHRRRRKKIRGNTKRDILGRYRHLGSSCKALLPQVASPCSLGLKETHRLVFVSPVVCLFVFGVFFSIYIQYLCLCFPRFFFAFFWEGSFLCKSLRIRHASWVLKYRNTRSGNTFFYIQKIIKATKFIITRSLSLKRVLSESNVLFSRFRHVSYVSD